MKLREMTIKNFRAIEALPLDFTDDLGRVHDIIVIVGPNGSGKSSILDAIWFGLMAQLPNKIEREGFRPEKEYVVHDRARFAQVDYELEITEAEREQIIQWRDELVELDAIGPYNYPDGRLGSITWTYPAQIGYEDQTRYEGYGGYRYNNTGYDWAILQGPKYSSRLRQLSARQIDGQKLAGGIYLFEQEREIDAPPVKNISTFPNDGAEALQAKLNIRELLINFGLSQQVRKFDLEDSWYYRIQSVFNTVCAPHKMGEVFSPVPGEWAIDFRDGDGNAYSFDGLSSGERSVLNFLVQYVYRRMSNAIILIDELELHLHPTWQRRLITGLRQLNDGNQFIITTHSLIIEQSVPSDAVIQLGQLDVPDWQYAISEDDA